MIDDDKHGHEHDGPSYPADARRLQSYTNAEQQLSQFQAPVFIHADNPHERLYVACLDGTGNDEAKPQFGPKTNVARIHDQIRTQSNSHIYAGYTSGPGTQDSWLARTRDGISGATYNERLEDAYKQFIDQAWDWKKQDPQADIRVVDTGFSRGAVEAAGLARLIQERGIQNPAGAIYTKNHDGQITHVEYTKQPLVAPGNVAQVALLFDPVATGYAQNHEDLRLPPSVISGLQIVAEDERRPAFKSDRIIDPGMTADGRFLGVTVAGAHSDVGGSYQRNGLGARSDNLAINYLNSLSDKPFLQNVAEPTDPRLNVVHRSEKAFPFNVDPRPLVNRDLPQGYNERLVPQETHYTTTQTPEGPVTTVTHNERPGVSDPFNAEPRAASLSASFARQSVPIGQPPAPEPVPTPAQPPAASDPNQAAMAAMQAQLQMMQAQLKAHQERQERQERHEQQERQNDRSAPTTQPEPNQHDIMQAAPQASAAQSASPATAHTAVPAHLAPVLYTPPAPRSASDAHLGDFSNPHHPLHDRYATFQAALAHAQEHPRHGDKLPYQPAQQDCLAASFTATLSADWSFEQNIKGFKQHDGKLSAYDHPGSIYQKSATVTIDPTRALAHTPEQHAAAWKARNVAPSAPAQHPAIEPTLVGPEDMRHPTHPHHAMFKQAREGIEDAHARWGRPQLDPEHLDRTAAQLTVEMRKVGKHTVDNVHLGLPEGTATQTPTYLVNGTLGIAASVNAQQQAQAPDVAQASQQLQVVDQQQQAQQAMQAQQHAQAQGQAPHR